MPTIAEILNSKSKQNAEYIKEAQRIQTEKDKQHLHALVTALRMHCFAKMDFTYSDDEKSPRIKYNEVWYRLKVLGDTPYIIHSITGAKFNFTQFIKKHQ